MSRTLLIDLDGTLVDSVPDLAASLNRLMAARGLPPFSAAEVARMVGDGVRALLERAFAARGGAPGADDLADYMADYAVHLADATRPYPGAAAALGRLRGAGWTVAVCTNKPEALARDVLARTGLLPLVGAIGGGDSFAVRKPNPSHLLATLARAGGTADAAVMAGDHRNDVLAAHGAGIPAVFAAWGYGPPAMAEGADAVAASCAELAELAPRLIA
ncbi:MAG: HAD hydrolase-like protein [Rhodospirillales bacterium]|nr:HAD hydrolase-like protein [Rhodospirillales bacterium]